MSSKGIRNSDPRNGEAAEGSATGDRLRKLTRYNGKTGLYTEDVGRRWNCGCS